MTCIYCPRPRLSRKDAVTCGDRECKIEHNRALNRALWWKNRDHLLAQKKEKQKTKKNLSEKAWWYDDRPVFGDKSARQIEERLNALAAQRRATRSWLRIENAWEQKPGTALHHRTDVETYSLEGAML